MKVKKGTLLLIAGAVWFIAGLNILRIGVVAAHSAWEHPVLQTLLAVIVFLLFFNLIFAGMTKKHAKRILNGVPDREPFWRFFDKKSYIIMAFMMTFGITLRQLQVVNPAYLGPFYIGLGAALCLAGLGFFAYYVVRVKNITIPCHHHKRSEQA